MDQKGAMDDGWLSVCLNGWDGMVKDSTVVGRSVVYPSVYCYCLLTATRIALYDRYSVPVLPTCCLPACLCIYLLVCRWKGGWKGGEVVSGYGSLINEAVISIFLGVREVCGGE